MQLINCLNHVNNTNFDFLDIMKTVHPFKIFINEFGPDFKY